MTKTTTTAAIASPSNGAPIRGTLISRHQDGTATIRFGGSLIRRGREITPADMLEAARRQSA